MERLRLAHLTGIKRVGIDMTKSINSNGITLIELLIATAITGILSVGIFTVFQSQNKSYIAQERVAEMQQNLRAGMDMLMREIRMAGYDPTTKAGAKIKSAEPDLIYFTKDDNGDGDLSDSNEHIVFDLYDDSGINVLGRTTSKNNIVIAEKPSGSGHFESNNPSPGPYHQPLADNIQALGFAYAFDTGDGDLDKSNNGHIIWAVDSDGDNNLDINLDTDDDGDIDAADGPGAGNNGLIGGVAITPVAVDDIRAVRVWMLARVGRINHTFSNTRTYVVGQKVITPNNSANNPNNNFPNFQMRLLTTTAKCRNMELK